MRRRGLHFVADADIVIAASDATFLDPHVSVGQVTAYEAITLLRTSPMEPIVRMALVGRHERITAERARQLGILSEVVDPPGQRLSRPTSWPPRSPAAPAAMAATKRALWRSRWASPRRAAGVRAAGGAVGASRPDRRARRLDREEGAAVGATST